MAIQVQPRPADTDGRPRVTRDDKNAAPRQKRIPQDPQSVPQQRARRAAEPKYPAGYFYG
jgi:hypothetical protein